MAKRELVFDLKKYVLEHIDDAVARGWIVVYVTPVVRSLTGKIIALECFVRWQDPSHGMLMPRDFLPPLEEQGWQYKIDLYAIQSACRIQQQRAREGRQPIKLILNISALDFSSALFLPKARDMIETYDCDPSTLVFEVVGAGRTMTERRKSFAFLRTLNEYGFSIGAERPKSAKKGDDKLDTLPLDHIKLDLRNKKKIDDAAKKSVADTIRQNRDADLKTLAVGVQSTEWLDYLKSIGCEMVEGYAILTPMSYQECARLCDLKELQAENAELSPLYDEAEEATDLLSAQSICLLQYNRNTGELTFLSANEAYLTALANMGFTDLGSVKDRIAGPKSELQQFLRRKGKTLTKEKPEHLEFYEGRLRVASDLTVQGELGETMILALHTWILPEKTNDPKDLLAVYLKATTGDFALMNLSRNLTQVIRYNVPLDRLEIQETPIEDYLQDLRQNRIAEKDRAAFRTFTDRGTIMGRLSKAPNKKLLQVFDTKRDDGTFVPMLHVITCDDQPGESECCYCVYDGLEEMRNALAARNPEKKIDKKPEIEKSEEKEEAGQKTKEILTSRQIVSALLTYQENEEKTGNGYQMLCLRLPSLSAAYAMAGDLERESLLTPLAIKALDNAYMLGNKAVVGVYKDQVVVLSGETEEEKVNEFLSSLSNSEMTTESLIADAYRSSKESFEYMLRAVTGKKEISSTAEQGTKIDYSAYDQLSFGVMVAGKNHKILYWNRMAESITGYEQQMMIGRACEVFGTQTKLSSGNTLCERMCSFTRTQTTGLPDITHVQFRHRDGYQIYLSLTGMVFRDAAGKSAVQVTFFQQETERLGEETSYQSSLAATNRDPVTGIANKQYLDSYLQSAVKIYARDGASFAALYVKLAGKDAEDMELQKISRALTSFTREGDICGRYEKMSFLVIMKTKDDTDLVKAGQRFQKCTEDSEIQCYIGVSNVRSKDTAEAVVNRAKGYAKLGLRAKYPVVTDGNAAEAALAALSNNQD